MSDSVQLEKIEFLFAIIMMAPASVSIALISGGSVSVPVCTMRVQNLLVLSVEPVVSGECLFVSAERYYVGAEGEFVSGECEFISGECEFVSAGRYYVGNVCEFVSGECEFVSGEFG